MCLVLKTWIMGKSPGRCYAFSSCVYDERAGELVRGGKRVRIPPQPARLLSLLLENPGSVVSRDELIAELWPDGQLQDYDHSIHRIVSQLREILRNRSSRSSKSIETLRKNGYRFTERVEIISAQEEIAAHRSTEIEATASAQPEIPAALITTGSIAESDVASLDHLQDVFVPPATRLSFRRLSVWLAGATALLLVAGLVSWRVRGSVRSPNKPVSLGIVPFDTTGPNAGPLAESVRLNLADILSQSPDVETRAVHSFDHSGPDENQILSRAQQLGVDALLFGKFDVTGDQCRFRLELVRSRDGVHLGSFQYNGKLEELAAISDRIERDIFERIHPYRNATNLNPSRPANSKAYAAYLRGRGFLQLWKDDDLRQAINAFHDAVTEDPSYARAYAGMASAFFVLSQHRQKEAPQDLDKCQEFAAKAIAIDPNLAEAHAMLGQAALNRDWNFLLAEQQLHQAINLDPDHAIYHQWLAILYGLEEKHDLSLKEIDKAHAADPNWAPLYMTEIFLAAIAGNYQRANQASNRLLQIMPDWSLAHEQYAMNLWDQGNYSKAISEWREAAVLEKDDDRLRLEEAGAKALKSGGVVAYARLRLRAIATRKGISHEEQDFVPAEWHAYACEWDKTLIELEQSVTERSPSALQISANPAYKPLHGDPRFVSLIKRIGIPVSPTSSL